MTINLNKILLRKYKFGFWSNIPKLKFPEDFFKHNINILSKQKNESKKFHTFRLKAYKKCKQIKLPLWSNLNITKINLNKLVIYSTPKVKNLYSNKKLFSTFKKCGLFLNKNIAIDTVFDSISIHITFRNKLAKYGIIFCSISKAIQIYPNLINMFLGMVVPYSDNFFAALNSAIFSDGSFCYIPKNTRCPLELSTYFRINDKISGQFERTLIIVESNSYLSYLEGCTATQYSINQLHAAVVELIVFTNAIIKYSTVQNWYSGDKNGVGGIFNCVTKRGLCFGKNSSIIWTQVEIGSSITWKYPSSILVGDKAISEFYSIALTNYYQQTDTGTKMIHLGKCTRSRIISKSISTGFSKNTYRGLVKIAKTAKYSKTYSQCDSLIIGNTSKIRAYPYIDILNFTSIIEHEAKISQINDEQFFYLQQRGMTKNLILNVMLGSFCKDIINQLPMEFALEANYLLQIELS